MALPGKISARQVDPRIQQDAAITVNNSIPGKPMLHIVIGPGTRITSKSSSQRIIDSAITSLINIAGNHATNRMTGKTTAVTAASFVLSVTTSGTSCGYSNGRITITASGGVAPYTYTMVGQPLRNNGYFAGLAAGTYQFVVEDATGQTATTTETIANTFPSLTANIVTTTGVSACDGADGSIVLAGAGGTPPYTYSMDMVNYQASNTFTNLTAGFYAFFVKDANGCVAATNNPFAIGYINCNRSIGFSFSSYTCSNTGSINGYDNGPNPPYSFSLDGVTYQSSGTFTNLPPGLHKFHSKDATGSVTIYTLPIYFQCSPLFSFTSGAASCGLHDGTLTLTGSGSIGPYTWSLDGINFQSGNIFTGLTPGFYQVAVKDGNGTINYGAAIVPENCPEVTAVATDEDCIAGPANGTITATASKGAPPYQYSLDGTNFQSANLFTGLIAGNYTVTVKDANGFTATTTVTVKLDCFTVTTTVVNVICSYHNGEITIIANGGITPYSYSLDGTNFQPGNVFTGLMAGTYPVTVQDATGQKRATSATITDVVGPGISVNVTPGSCNLNDGSLTITATGGTPPYQYSIDNLNFQSANTFNNLYVGTLYLATIKDANGCTALLNVRPSLNCLLMNATVVDESCSQGDGSITVNAMNGIAPYQYSIDGTNFQNSNLFAGLSAGPYTVVVKAADGSTKSASVVINDVCITVTANVTNENCAKANGSIKATAANGTPPYQYSLDGVLFQNDPVFAGLSAGGYIVSVKDANGQASSIPATIINIPGPQISILTTNASCTRRDGSITASGTGGQLPFQYSLDPGTSQPSPVFYNLANGSYTVTIRDANGCEASLLADVLINNTLVVEAGNDLATCEGTGVTIPATSNGTGFQWSPATSLSNGAIMNPIARPLTATKYYVIATLGVCTKKDSVIVQVNPAPIAHADKDTTICFGQNVPLSGSGGVGFHWSPGMYLSNVYAQNPIVSKPANSITYHLQVTDQLGCASLNNATTVVTVTPPPFVFAGNDTIMSIGQSLPLGAVDVNNSGFTTYIWSPGGGLNSPFIQNPVAIVERSITYTVIARTPAGCQGSAKINIKAYQGPEIYVPNAFTPNRDGRNDVLKPITVGIRTLKYFAIYNRWGQRIFYSTNPSLGWDGKMGQREQGTTSFTWSAEGVDYNNNIIRRKGIVILLR